ncbi:MAG: methyltransferase [Chloroflexi bacterium]|nr:methyltransferase [Chloroflexota bacterium]
MPGPDRLSERLLLDALEAEARRPDRQSSGGPSALLIGVQACETVAAANALLGADRVCLLHLDRAAGGVGCGLGNAEAMLGGDGLPAGPFDVLGLNVEAARTYRVLREIVATAAGQLAPDGCLLVAGPRKGGAEAMASTMRTHFAAVEVVHYRKGHRVYRAALPLGPGSTQDAADQSDAASATPAAAALPVVSLELRGQTLQLVQDDRVFARGGLDPATRMLAEVFEVPPGAEVLDLGCGGGVLGILAALLDPTARCTLVDADPLAVAAARQGAERSRAAGVAIHLSNLLDDLPGQTFDAILMNPPFHRGRAQDVTLGERFLRTAAAALRPGGRVWVVCNRFLPYERTLRAALGNVREAAGDRAYKVLVAERGGSAPSR